MTESSNIPPPIDERSWESIAASSFDTVKLRRRVGWSALILGSICIGALLAAVEPLWVVAIVGGLTVTAFVANRPLWGLLFVMSIWYIRPGEMWGVPYAAKFATGILLAAFLVKKSLTKEGWVRTPMSRWVGMFLIATLLSAVNAYWLAAYKDEMNAFLIVLVGYLLVLNLSATRRDFMVVLHAFVFLTGIISLLGMKEYLFGSEGVGFRTSGITGGIFASANDFAMVLCMFIPVAMMLAKSVRNLPLKVLLYGNTLLFLVVITMTSSRGGFLGLVVVALLLTWNSRRRLMAFTLLPVLTAVFLALSPASFRDRIVSIQDYGEDESAQARLDSWAAGRRMFLASPLTGIGAGCFQFAAMDYGLGRIEHVAHNTFINVLAETGILGIVSFTGMLIFGLIASHRAAKRCSARGDPVAAAAARGLFIGIWGYTVTAVFLSTSFYPNLYWFMALSASIDVWSRVELADKSINEAKPESRIPAIEFTGEIDG